MRLPQDLLSGNYIKPRIFLCEVDKERICQLETTNTNGTFKFNSYSEISFDVGRLYSNITTGETKLNPYYDKIEALRLIEIENVGYFELQGPELSSDGIQETKSCTAYSLEYSLSNKYLSDFVINTGEIGSVEVTYAEDVLKDINNIIPVTLYNPEIPELSLLHLVLQSAYGWNIGYVDTSLRSLRRQITVDRESVYDFLMNEVCEKFNCYIVFNTINNTINIYAESLVSKFIGDGITNTFIISPPFAQVETVSVGGYKTTRWTYNSSTGALTLEDIPETGAHIEVVDGALVEWETDVYVGFDNLAQEVHVNYDADAIKTQLTVSYGDDGDIREANFGLPYLVDISYYYTIDWMGQELYDAYTTYMQKSNGLQLEYTNNSQEALNISDKIYYEETRMSLEFSLVQSVNSETIGTYYVRQGEEGNYYYKEVILPGEYNANEKYYSNATTNVTEEKITNFYNVLKKYFHDENEDGDNYTSWKTDLDTLSSEFEFMQTYTLSYLSTELAKVTTNRTDESKNSVATTAINNFLSEIWSELGKTPLETLYLSPYKTIQNTNIEAGWSNVNDEKYGYYYPVLLMISSIEAAITIRDNTINTYKNQRQTYYDNNEIIREQLSMNSNFTDQQLVRLSAFLREDELHLDDIVETSEDNISSSFKVKQDAMESGRIELQKMCQPQLQFSMSMANIYALPEFAPIIDQFQLGKVIKVGIRSDYIKQSRLLQVDINLDDFSDFSCEFGDLTNLRTQSDIHADLLKNAITAGKSVATNSGRWTQGADTITAIDLKIQNGLLDATTQIKAIDGKQGVVIDKYGIWLTKKDDNGNVDPCQAKLVNNMIIMSDDGFKTSKTALGHINYDNHTYYGLIAEAVLSGYIESSTIIGGTIGIGEYLDDGVKKHHFSVDKDGNVSMTGDIDIKLDADNIHLEGFATINNHFYIDEDGYMHADQGGTVGGWNITHEHLEKIGQSEDKKTKYRAFLYAPATVGPLSIAFGISQTTDDTQTFPFQVRYDGHMIATSAEITGKVTAENGTIGGWNITGGYLDKSVTIGNTTYRAYIAAPENPQTNNGAFAITQTVDGTTSWPFIVTYDGTLTARKAKIEGTITAEDGQIGGWTITENKLYRYWAATSDTAKTSSGMAAEKATGLAFWAGFSGTGETPWDDASWRDKTKFYVTHAGKLCAKGADIDGKITATSGEIGSWTISEKYINTDKLDNKGNGTRFRLNSALTPDTTTTWIRASTLSNNGETDATTFCVYKDGRMKATQADIKGNIEADSGTIGGWTINENFIESTKSGVGSFRITGATSSSYTTWIYAKDGNGTTTFKVDKDGTMTAAGAVIKGTLKAGSIIDNSKWKVTSTGFQMGTFGQEDCVAFNNECLSAARKGDGWEDVDWMDVWGCCNDWAIEWSSESDANVKNSISDLEADYNTLFDSLTPCRYKYNHGTSNRYHTGFIAQEVIEAIDHSGLTTQDFAGVIHLDKPNANGCEWLLRRDEFVALNTWQIQKAKARITELEEKVAQLEALINKE